MSAARGPSRYELRVDGHLDPHWSTWFGRLALTLQNDGTTALHGPVADQAELHGLLAKVRDLGATLVSLTPLDVPDTQLVADCAAGDRHDVPMSTPLDAVSWPLRTARLSIRRATRDDLKATWGFRRLDEVSRWLTRAPVTLEQHRAQFEEPGSLAKTLVIELRDNRPEQDPAGGVVIGDLMLKVEDAWAQAEVADRASGVQAELGWVLDPDHAGRGYATEAVRELIRLCFQDLGLRRLTGNCFAANEASWRLMERVGMRREVHTVRESLHRSGEWLDGLGYALLAEEWNDPA